jgi:hypothetical protein
MVDEVTVADLYEVVADDEVMVEARVMVDEVTVADLYEVADDDIRVHIKIIHKFLITIEMHSQYQKIQLHILLICQIIQKIMFVDFGITTIEPTIV